MDEWKRVVWCLRPNGHRQGCAQKKGTIFRSEDVTSAPLFIEWSFLGSPMWPSSKTCLALPCGCVRKLVVSVSIMRAWTKRKDMPHAEAYIKTEQTCTFPWDRSSTSPSTMDWISPTAFRMRSLSSGLTQRSATRIASSSNVRRARSPEYQPTYFINHGFNNVPNL